MPKFCRGDLMKNNNDDDFYGEWQHTLNLDIGKEEIFRDKSKFMGHAQSAPIFR